MTAPARRGPSSLRSGVPVLLVAASAVAGALLMVAGDGLGVGVLSPWCSARCADRVGGAASLDQAVRRRAVERLPGGPVRDAPGRRPGRTRPGCEQADQRRPQSHPGFRASADDAERALHEDDPSRALRSIHEQARGATSELRRQLGLLRETPDQPGDGRRRSRWRGPPPTGRPRRPRAQRRWLPF